MDIRMVRAEDVEEAELAAVDEEFHDYYGPERFWQPWMRETYLDAIQKVHEQYAGQVAA
ncbi:hypothetical protein [Streptomyces sp. CB01201]|uniref:hypothetical protein n=1 Tax=Streptomyces sp. CB01201 TaxID=2020324 RepID=UPI00131AD53D|nr:hypothetical protein [Streptomyces sp. CB01201]